VGYQTIFRRYEFKYLLKREEKERLLDQISCLLQSDLYPQSTVRNIYFNTENDLLIRRSMEKPIYKEKLRIRSYRKASCDSTVFVELKKKYRHVVYNRRVSLAEKDAREWLCGSGRRENPTQIEKEIDYFLNFYSSLKPSLFLSYDRVAFADSGESDLRITFDENILFRQEALDLREDVWGTPLLPEDKVLMEIKCAGGMPLWLTNVLSREKIYKTSFSKYGTAYLNFIISNSKENKTYAG